MFLKKTLIILLFICFSSVIYSQPADTLPIIDNTEKTYVDTIEDNIYQDIRIYELIEIHKNINKKMGGIPGYRIQIFFDSGNYSKQNALKAKTNFHMIYSSMPVYLIFEEPYYKVRIGDFRSRMDAKSYLQEINEEDDAFKHAFIVKCEINLPKINLE